MNAINTIRPFKVGPNIWVFNDASKGLDHEPFVGRTNIIIDHMVKHLIAPEKGFTCMFSGKRFPGATVKLEWVSYDEDTDGNWYKETTTGYEGWLCPALLEYFDKAPAEIWIGVDQ